MRAVKWLLGILGILLLFAVGGLVFIYYFTDPKQLVDLLSKELSKAYSLEVKTDKVQLDLTKGVRMSGVTLWDVSSQKQKLLLSFEEGGLVYNPVALFSGKLDILSISASKLSLSDTNLAYLISIFNNKQTNQGKSSVKLILRSVSFKDSSFIYTDIPVGIDLNVNFGVNLDNSQVKGKLEAKFGKISFQGTFRDLFVELDSFHLDGLFPAAPPLSFYSAEGEFILTDDGDYRFNGKKVRISYSNYSAQIDKPFVLIYQAKLSNLLVTNLLLKISNSEALIGRLNYSIPDEALEMSITDIQAELSDFLTEGKAGVSGFIALEYRKKLLLSGDLTFANLEYGFLKGGLGMISLTNNSAGVILEAKIPGGDIKINGEASDYAQGPWNIRISSKELALDTLLPEISKGKKGSAGSSGLPIAVGIKADVGKMSYGKLRADNISLNANYQDNHWIISKMNLEFIRGIFSASGDLTGGILSGNARFDDGKLKELSGLLLEGDRRLYGTISGSTAFQLDLNYAAQTRGSIQLKVKNGELKNFILQEEVSRILFDIPLDDIVFDNASLNGKLNGTSFQLQQFNFDSPDIQLDATGNIELTNLNLSLQTRLSVTKDYLSGLPNVSQIFTSGYEEGDYIRFRIGMNGPLSKPEVKLIR